MVSLEVFLIALLIVSTFTSLATEGIKKIFAEHNWKYNANTIAGVTSAVLSTGLGIGYVIAVGMPFTGQIVVCIIALVFISWLCAMVGYDKVIAQLKNIKKG